MKEDVALARVTKARQLLAEASTAAQAKQVSDMAKGAEVFALKQGAEEAAQFAHEVHADALRLCGDFLADREMNKGGRPTTKTGNNRRPVSTLRHDHISKRESQEAQAVAEMAREYPQIFADFRSGDLSLMALVRKLKEKVIAGRRRKAQPDKIDNRILIGDFRTVDVPNGCLSLILTDPPYDRASIELYADLSEFAFRKLAVGGSLVCYVGHVQLLAAIEGLSQHLRFWWPCACIHAGSKALMREYGIRVGWKPILWFVNGIREDRTQIICDTVSGGAEKEFHDWQQAESEAVYWIEALCPEDGIVCDPFLGGGTTAAAAQSKGRKWIGIEIDPEAAAIASKRLES